MCCCTNLSLLVCLFLLFLVSVLVVAFNSSMIVTTEGDNNFQACIDIVNGTIDAGLNVSIIYTLQDEASKNILKIVIKIYSQKIVSYFLCVSFLFCDRAVEAAITCYSFG